MKTNIQLLCTFSTISTYKFTIDNLKSLYAITSILDRRIFVFDNKKNLEEIILTYNVLCDADNKRSERLPKTILIHRKKSTNTLYTLNAMNAIIKEENNGILDEKYQIKWDLYKNCLIITNDIGYKIIELNLKEIYKI